MITYTTKKFTYNPESMHFAGEASELGGMPQKFDLISEWTNRKITFIRNNALKDADGDITLCQYSPEDLAYSALSLTIYND